MFQKQSECLLAVAGDLNAATSVGTVSTAAVCGTVVLYGDCSSVGSLPEAQIAVSSPTSVALGSGSRVQSFQSLTTGDTCCGLSLLLLLVQERTLSEPRY